MPARALREARRARSPTAPPGCSASAFAGGLDSDAGGRATSSSATASSAASGGAMRATDDAPGATRLAAAPAPRACRWTCGASSRVPIRRGDSRRETARSPRHRRPRRRHGEPLAPRPRPACPSRSCGSWSIPPSAHFPRACPGGDRSGRRASTMPDAGARAAGADPREIAGAAGARARQRRSRERAYAALLRPPARPCWLRWWPRWSRTLLLEHVFGRARLVERDLRRHRAFGLDAEHRHLQRLPRPREGVVDGGTLIAAMDHAVGALLVACRCRSCPSPWSPSAP